MHETRKAQPSFRADGFAIFTRWPTLVAFLLIAAFSGAGFQSANSVLQQYRQLLDSRRGDNTLQLANREQPRLAVVVAAAEKQKSTWQGQADGIIPSVPALAHPFYIWRGITLSRQERLSRFAGLAFARGPPSLS